MRAHRLTLSLALTGALLTAPLASAQAETCSPARVLFLVDKSSSMVGTTVGGETLWSLAGTALDDVTQEFESKLELGLMLFPGGPSCTLPELNVVPALDTHDEIIDSLGEAPPLPFTDGAHATPMHQSLSQAATEPVLAPGNTARVVVLITDGEQWCSASDPDTAERLRPIDSIGELNDRGIITYVVGFGSAYDAYVLNQMAAEAGTSRPGCNPEGTSASASDSCFYKAENSDELSDVLRTIAQEVSEDETCDGLDNDCDDMVDEGLSMPCDTDCGQGTQVCEDGEWSECSGGMPADEICDGDDNDCDGSIDEGEANGGGPNNDDVGISPSVCTFDDEPEMMAEEEPAGGVVSGCGCDQAGGHGVVGGLLLSLFALLPLATRRRKDR